VGKLKFFHFCPPWKNIFGYAWKNPLLVSAKILPTPMFRVKVVNFSRVLKDNKKGRWLYFR